MRNLGLVLLAVALFGFFYCSTRLAGLEPVPPGTELGDYLRHDAGRWELGRYGAAILGLIGLLLALFPRGR